MSDVPSLILPLLLSGAALAAGADDNAIRGTVGVCIRWGADPDHVQEAVVVVPSRNPALDAGIPESVRRMGWKRPGGDYRGGWIGIWMAINEPGDPRLPFPDCSKLPRHDGATPVSDRETTT